jgi:hypothetical protein
MNGMDTLMSKGEKMVTREHEHEYAYECVSINACH